MIFDTLITGLLVLLIMKLWQKHIKRKEIWVIEDSESDIMLFKINLNLDEYDVKYFHSVQGMKFKVAISPPDAVICDFYLQDRINGDQVREFFKRNHIPVVLTTGYDGEINGIPEKAIIRKRNDKSFYREMEDWVHKVTA